MTTLLIIAVLAAVAAFAILRYGRLWRVKTLHGLSTPGRIPRIKGPRRYEAQVVGESHYRASFLELARRHKPTDTAAESFGDAVLTLEDTNRHDPNAVAITLEGLSVGYLDRATAKDFRAALQRDGLTRFKQFACGARLYWGGDDKLFSVTLDLPIDD